MLDTKDFIQEMPIVTKTDRDVEIPTLVDYIKRLNPIDSLLDVGAHWSWAYYAEQIRPFIKKYDGVDILDDPQTAAIVDTYYAKNVFDVELPQYDVVICVSTIEHAGVSTYSVESVEQEQNRLFEKCLALTRKHLWISFPVGMPYVFPGQLSIITDKQLKRWERLTSNFKVVERFFHNQAGPQFNTPWREHRNRKAGVLQQYWDYCGNQAICVLEVTK